MFYPRLCTYKFSINNHALFCLSWKENLLNNQKSQNIMNLIAVWVYSILTNFYLIFKNIASFLFQDLKLNFFANGFRLCSR